MTPPAPPAAAAHPAPSRNEVVSVVVPMYQSAATVEQTVRSALSDFDASSVPGEVVVANDGSTDDGPRIVQALAAADARVRLVHKPNGGLSSARNCGLAAAGGKWVRFLDADDLAVPGGLARLLACAQTTGAACGGQDLIDDSGLSMEREISARPGPDGCIGVEQLRTGNAMGVGTVLLRRDLLGENSFDQTLPVCEDWDLWLRLAQQGVRFHALPGWQPPVKRYRVRAGSLSKKFRLMHDVGARVLRGAQARGAQVEAGLLGLALGYGAMQAVAADPGARGHGGGIEMLAGHRPRIVGAQALASDGFAAVLLGLGCRPDSRGPHRRIWAAALANWWEHLRVAGWTDAPAIAMAWHELAARTVSPREVGRMCVAHARRLARQSGPDAERLVIVGLGKNGRAVMQALAEAGLCHAATARDDALAGRFAQELPIAWESMNTPIPPDAAVIITPQNDDRLTERLASTAGVDPHRVIRWNQVLEHLASQEYEDLLLASTAAVAGNMPSLRCA